MKHFLSLKDLTKKQILHIFELAHKIKRNPSKFSRVLTGKYIGLLFEKPSLRTRVSFEVGIRRLGGDSIYLSDKEVQFGKRESVSDIAKTLSCYLNAVVLRTFSHKALLEFADSSSLKVINGLTDLLHPAQVLSDLFTIYEKRSNLNNLKISFIGDGNNVCHSLMLGSAVLGLNLSVANPYGFEPDENITKEALAIAGKTKAKIEFFNKPQPAARDSDVIYTDVWVSMGKEKEADYRRKAFKDFQVNSAIVKEARKNCLVLHCLPAHRGEEITDKVIDSRNSVVFEQAENRLYAQMAVLVWLFSK